MKKPISIKLDERLWVYVKSKTNKSRYIEQLIKQDLHQQQLQPIVSAVMQELLSNEVFFSEMQERLTGTKVIKTEKEEQFVPKPPDPQTGYECCERSSPCKHWVFDDNDEVWRNILTGATKSE